MSVSVEQSPFSAKLLLHVNKYTVRGTSTALMISRQNSASFFYRAQRNDQAKSGDVVRSTVITPKQKPPKLRKIQA